MIFQRVKNNNNLLLNKTVVAGLKLIVSHSRIFKEYLTEDSEKMFYRIFNLCKHQNKKLHGIAFLAFEEFISQVSNELISGVRNPINNQETFKVNNFVINSQRINYQSFLYVNLMTY